MSRSAARARTGGDRASLYQEITDKIIAELEAGRVPWVQPWGTVAAKASLAMPKNAATKRQYSGINVLTLWDAVIEHGFSTQNWLTFRQALGLGGYVRKGEHGTTVVYADRFVPDEERRRAERDGDEPNAIPFVKRFTVFNTDQCESLPPELTSASAPVPGGLILLHAETLIAATGADFRIGGDRAFYSPVHDFIQVPRPETYFEPINWHRTALHELGHWSGHSSRLGRDLSGNFGSAPYAKEELVAEMTAAFVCASLGIVPTVRHADYIGAWLEVLREDDRAIVRAASAHRRRPTICSHFAPTPTNPSKFRTLPISSSQQAGDTRGVIPRCPSTRGRPQSEGGRLRRDGSRARERPAATVTEIPRCANPTIRPYGITANTSRARFDRSRRLHALIRARRPPQRLRLRGGQGLLHRRPLAGH
jgi:antirestriction protein ArdC